MPDYLIICDGGALNNQDATKRKAYGSYQIETGGRTFGPYRHEFGANTNNVAEWKIVAIALEHVATYAYQDKYSAVLHTDSQLVHGHLTLGWKRKAKFDPYYESAKKSMATIGDVTIQKVPRAAIEAVLGH